MERNTSSRLYATIKEPKLYDYRDYIGQEVILGLAGTDEFGNKVIKHINGLIGLSQNGKALGLYENVSEEGRGIANKLMPLDMNSPVIEVMVPCVVETLSNRNDSSGKERTDLLYKLVAEPNNPNSRLRHEYRFQSRHS